MSSTGATEAHLDQADHDTSKDHRDDYDRSRRSRFRFKKHRSHSKDALQDPSHSDTSKRSSSHRHHHRHHHRSKRRKTENTHATNEPPAPADGSLDPDIAFRESLFDALGDDEGAAFWESVYGQPIHTYSTTYTTPQGELEQMTEDEYTAFVRMKMWEKTHQHIIEERERREKVMREEAERRKKGIEEEEKLRRDRDGFVRGVEEALGRGRARTERKMWRGVWERYERMWEDLKRREKDDRDGGDISSGGQPQTNTGDNDVEATVQPQKQPQRNRPDKTLLTILLPWPVKSLKHTDINPSNIEAFMQNAPPFTTSASTDANQHQQQELAFLKSERIRWHPDKIQHRYGGLGVDEETLRLVTVVFQVVDRMVGEARGRIERREKGRG